MTAVERSPFRLAPCRARQRMVRRLVGSLLVLAAVSAAGPARAHHRVWALDDSYKLNPHTAAVYTVGSLGNVENRNPVWNKADRTVRIAGARNEVVAFQIVVQAGPRPLENANVVPDDLRGPSTIPRSTMSLFRAHYTHVERPSKWPGPSTGAGWYPDALVPFDIPAGAPFAVPANFAQTVWVDILIPQSVPAGRYVGVFQITVAGEGSIALPVELSLWDITLPSERHLRFWSNYSEIDRAFGLDANQPRARERMDRIEQRLWRLAHDHRLDALHRHSMVHPRTRPGDDGSVEVDWAEFDARYGRLLDGSLFPDGLPPTLFLLPPILHEGSRWPRGTDAAFLAAVRSTAAHWRTKGWKLDRTFIYLGDEPKSDAAAWDEIKRHARFVKQVAPEIRTTVAFNRLSPSHVQAFTGLLDFWLVDAGHYRTNLLELRRAAGDWVGFYQQGEPWIGNETIDTDALAFRTWPWIAWKYRVDVVYLYLMTYWASWRPGFDIWTNPRNWQTSNSQGVLVYPGRRLGTDDVMPSIRLKMIRRGMQDYEYFWLARQRGHDPDPIVGQVIRRALDATTRGEAAGGEWSRDPIDWAWARAEVARMIMATLPASG